MSANVPITVAHGDGIGPEIMEASLHIIQEAGAGLRGNSFGMEPSSCESLKAAQCSSARPKAHREVVRRDMKMGIDGIDACIGWPSRETPIRRASARRETLPTDASRCRFTASNGGTTSNKTVARIGCVLGQGLEIVNTETLRTYNGAAGYTLSQGQ